MEPPPPPSYNEAVTNLNYTSTSVDLDDEPEELEGNDSYGTENSQYDDGAESNALLESENVTSPGSPPHNIGETYFGIRDSSYSSRESQFIASGSSHDSGSLPKTTGSQNTTSGQPSGSRSPPQIAESQFRTTDSPYDPRTPLHTEESDYRATGGSSGSLPQIEESNWRTIDSPSDSGTPLHARQVQSTPSALPEASVSSAQTQPSPPSYDEAFINPGLARNNMQISRSALSGAHRNPLVDPEQPPPSYNTVVGSQGSRFYPPINAVNSIYATQPSTSGAGINRYPAEHTYGSGTHGSRKYQGYQRMPHGSYIPVIHNTNEQSSLTGPSAMYNSYGQGRPNTSTGNPCNVQGYNTTPLAYVDPNSIPQEKTNTCGKLCTLCVCVGLIFIPLIIYLMLLN